MKIRKSRPEKRLVLQVPDVVQKLSTLDLIKRAVSIWLDKVGYKKMPISDAKNGMPEMQNWENVYSFAIVLDGEVVDLMRVQQRLAVVLQAQPKFVKFDPEIVQPRIGWKYENDFIDPNLSFDIKPMTFDLGRDDETKN
jgi:hypothetical protein